MQIDTTSFDKRKAVPYDPERSDNGYQPRPFGRLAPKSIIVHTTNGHAGTSFYSEARYIQLSRAISAHYLIGKDGTIVQFLDPRSYIAYHAGCVKAQLWTNNFAIGIEMHHTTTEGPISIATKSALDWLVRQLMRDYTIPAQNIDTHRNVAVFCPGSVNAGKLGRKIDPSGFPDNEFYAWRSTLVAAGQYTTYRVINPRGVNVRQQPKVSMNIAGILLYGDTFESDVLKVDEKGETHTGVAGSSNQWAHIYRGISEGKPVDQLGFVSLSNLQQI